MTHLNEKEEKSLDDAGVVKLKRGSLTFNVFKKDVYCYGEIDYNKGSDDYETLSNQDWFIDCDMQGVMVPSNYDYENNIIVSDIKGGRWYDTVKTEIVAQFKHGQLGKPKRSIIFKHYV